MSSFGNRDAYRSFLNTKHVAAPMRGHAPTIPLSGCLFDYQKTAVDYAVRCGSAALFMDTGLGKTICQLEWARHVPGDVIILTPLAVASQTVREAAKIGVECAQSRDGKKAGKITVTNYERLEHFNLNDYVGVVLDESSILKSFMGKTKQMLCERFASYQYKLACTATPAPNDYMELGNHSDFLGVMPSNEMLSRWFINDTMNFGSYRLKGHAVESFWRWIASWAVCASKPSDLGGDDSRHALPPLTTTPHFCEVDMTVNRKQDELFRSNVLSATEIHADKRSTMNDRVLRVLDLCKSSDYHLVWCETNDESAALAKAFGDKCVEVVGSDHPDKKEEKLERFSLGQVQVMVTKPSIAGFGLNWQHCNHVVFASMSYSYEAFYQAIRRSWRFGQTRPVHVDCVMAETERQIWGAVQEKLHAHEEMKTAMRAASISKSSISEIKEHYSPKHIAKAPLWLKSNA